MIEQKQKRHRDKKGEGGQGEIGDQDRSWLGRHPEIKRGRRDVDRVRTTAIVRYRRRERQTEKVT